METHVLLLLCGTSPAIVTETIWALRDDLPQKVVVVTTEVGRAALRRELFEAGVWQSLQQLLPGGETVHFGNNSSSIRVIPRGDLYGDAEDVVASEDSLEFADFLLEILRQYTENPEVRLTFSIAGGRKTMSATGALCMSLLGRDCDRLCHILVNPPYDRSDLSPKFHFPIHGMTHQLSDGTVFRSEDAKITLCELPYVHQRYLFEKQAALPGSYRSLVASANGRLREQRDARIEFDPQNFQVHIAGRSIRFPMREFLVYYFLAERCREGKQSLRGTTALHEEFQDVVREWSTEAFDLDFALKKDDFLEYLKAHDAGELRKIVTSIGKILLDNGIHADSAFCPTSGRGTYGLRASREQIQLK